MAYRDRYRRLTGQELRFALDSASIAIDRAFESRRPGRGLLIHNARRRYWRIEDETDRRKAEKKQYGNVKDASIDYQGTIDRT
jgi:hypothetical protein